MKLIPMDPNMSEEDRTTFRNRQNKVRDNILSDDTVLGRRMKELSKEGAFNGFGADKKTIQKGEVSAYLEGLKKDRKDFNKELKNLKKSHEKSISEETRNALDAAIKATDSKSAFSPEKIQAAFAALKAEADKEYAADLSEVKRRENAGKTTSAKKKGIDTANHIRPLKQYVERTMAYYQNRMTAASERGIYTNESVTRQQELSQRAGSLRLDQALNRFNTVPTRLVGAPKESTMHRITREAVQKLQTLRQEFEGIDQDARPEEWRQKATELMEQAKTVSDLSTEYVKGKTGMFDNKERIHGGEDLHREAELLRISLRNRLEMDRKCTAIKDNTHRVEPVKIEDLKKAAEEKKEGRLRTEFKNAKASIDEAKKEKIRPRSKDASDAKKVHNINFDDMMKKHGVGTAKKKAEGKAAHSEVKQAAKQVEAEKKGPAK